MNAAELRALSEALSWHVGQTFTPQHKETFAQAAEVIELLAWAENNNNRDVVVDRGEGLWSAWWEGGPQVYAKTLIGTLRRAREAAKV